MADWRNHVGRTLRWLLSVAAVAGLVSAYSSDTTLFKRPAEKSAYYAEKLHKELVRAGLVFLYTAEDAAENDWISGQPIWCSDVEAVPGRFGQALALSGARHTHIELPLRWSALNPVFTVSLVLQIDKKSADQDILFAPSAYGWFGLKLDRGQLSLFAPGGTPTNPVNQTISFPFTNYNEFVNLAVVFDRTKGFARLYENGVLRGALTGSFSPAPGAPLMIGKSTRQRIVEPFSGAIDEVLVWKRALSPEEVVREASRTVSAPVFYGGDRFGKYEAALSRQALISRVLRHVDLFLPWRHPGPEQLNSVPEIHLVLSKKDEKYFARQHRACLATGNLLVQAADARRVEVLEGGRAARAKLCLAGSARGYPDSPRKTFLLEPEDGTLLGLRRLRLTPPEAADWFAPLLETRVARETGAAAVSNGICRLVINGDHAGFYLFEDYERLGVYPGSHREVLMGSRSRGSWFRLGSGNFPALSRDAFLALRDEVDRETRPYFLHDPASPVSGRELEYKLRMLRREVGLWPLNEGLAAQNAPAKASVMTVNPFSVLGSNPAPAYLLYDLALPTSGVGGVRYTWSSGNTDVLGNDGRVIRPDTEGPVKVALTLSAADANGLVKRDLVFRVMPRTLKLSAMFIWAREPLGRAHRVNGAIEYRLPDEKLPPQRWLAARANRAGLAFRGNTSLSMTKRPVAISLPEPHGLWGSTNLVDLMLVNPRYDETLVHNKLAFELYRRIAPPELALFARHVDWVEVFFNGHYQGLYELSPSGDGEWLNLPPVQPDDPSAAVAYKLHHPPPTAVEQIAMRQIEPSRRYGHYPEPAMRLESVVGTGSPEQFVAEVDSQIDFESLMHLHLLLNLCENRNGEPFKYNLHEIMVRPGAGEKFRFIPWDMDATFEARGYVWFDSKIFKRMRHEYPGYMEKLSRRWKELRGGPLDLDQIRPLIDQYGQTLSGYIEYDYARRAATNLPPHAAQLELLKNEIRRRFLELDRVLDPAGAAIQKEEDISAR